MSTGACRACSATRCRACAWCRPRPVAASAARRSIPRCIAGHAALLALKSGRPVKLIYDRAEDMLATTKRHPSIVRHRTGVTRDGRLVAMDIEVILDGGAYITLVPVVLSRGCDSRRRARTAATTSASRRARCTRTRRPTAPFAGSARRRRSSRWKSTWTASPRRSGMDSVRLRERNALRPGDTTATGQTLRRGLQPRSRCCAGGAALELSAGSAKTYAGTDRGIGLALFYHGSGFTGSGELKLASRATLELTATGVPMLTSSTEIGQGTRTMHAQIVADALGVPYERVEVAIPDTQQRARQRADRGVAHLHGGRADSSTRARRRCAGSSATSRRPSTTRGTDPCPSQPVRAAGLDPVGRGHLPGRRVRHVRVGVRRRRGGARSRYLRGAAASGHGRQRDRQGDPSGAGEADRSKAARRRDWATRCSSAW